MRHHASWAVTVLLFGCGEPAAAPPAAPAPASPAPATPAATAQPPVVPAPSEPPRTIFELEDATVLGAARALATATGTAVAVDPQASEIAGCARITVVAPAPSRPDEVVALVGQALEGSGLRLERSAEGAIVRRVPDVDPPASCARARVLPSTPPAGEAAEERAAVAERVIAGIRREAEGRYAVRREALEQALANQAVLMRSARIVPHMREGRVIGLKLYGIRSTSILSALGFRNGDMVLTVGGHDISSPERALEAYSNLRNADRLTVRVERRGREMDLHYRFVGR